MKFTLISLALVLGLCDAARRRATTAATTASLEGRQLGHRDQENAWDLLELQKLDNRRDFWNDPNSPANNTESENSGSLSARQGYPGLPGPGDTNELPGPISTTQKPSSPIILPPGCSALRGQFPSPKNCANYLNCWDGVVIEQTCPNGLLFNAISQVCDYEYNVNCGDRPLPAPRPSLPSGTKLCPEPNGRYRSATNCSEFYVCVYRKPIKFSCPRRLVYNDILGVCDYPYNVDCKGAATPAPPPITISIITTEPTQSQTRPQPPPQPQPQPQPLPLPQPLPPYGAPQVTLPTVPPYGAPYPSNPWLGKSHPDSEPWQQQPPSPQLQTDKEDEEAVVQEQPQSQELLENPWQLLQNIPAGLAAVPCENGKIQRLNEACSNVVVCRNGRPQLIQCSTGLSYDRPSDSCKPISVAKC